ncbi:leucine-rich repeat protein soc-2-like [Paramacrobiotus metropolitanus]|uniref:leucine-rich repeat protein soc-2-like n=1 Tax=Paramacrobiotus metropolitanus TaxID=2943436 RepID=UPI0024464E2F|nr:leucine-rich repeat protein soc-2-like [Paramacrobiotus metropolitanus]
MRDIIMTAVIRFFVLFLCDCHFSATLAQCPTLPSGHCYVDCTQPVYKIICEDVNGNALHSDIMVYQDSPQSLELTIWNSPAVSRLGSTILSTVANQITSLYLDNLRNLVLFPELNDLSKMKDLKIMNSPRLMDMPAELLPHGIETIHLYATNITELINDFDEVPRIPTVHTFSFSHGTLRHIQPHFFHIFPNLQTLRISHTRFLLDTIDDKTIYPEAKLYSLQFTDNDFSAVPENVSTRMLYRLFADTNIGDGGEVDVSNNGLLITTDTVTAMQRLRRIRSLNLRGNRFRDFSFLTTGFRGFNRLEFLDLTGTDLLNVKGVFAGLPKLRTLLLADNNFHDLSLIDIFADSQSEKLRVLDLSGNHLRALPTAGGNEAFSEFLEEFNLSHNQLNLDQIQDYENSSATFNDYQNLKFLDISYNNLRKFAGERLTRLRKLEKLILACNNFTRITKASFDLLPVTLKFLNLSFCATKEAESPRFTNDALSTLPVQLETLVFTQGFLKNSVFERFKLAKKLRLKHLDLSWNSISHIPHKSDILFPLINIQSLRLKANLFQSIAPKEFEYFPALRELDLSSNMIISIGPSDLDGLYNLEVLDLSENSIIQVEKGAFKYLGKLKSLYFRKNAFTNIGTMFSGILYPQLQQLSLDGMPLNCVDADIAGLFPHLMWIYLNRSQPLYMAYGSFRKMKEHVRTVPPQPVPFDPPTAADLGCDEDMPYQTIMKNYHRITVPDGSNKVGQQMILNFPSCHVDAERNLKTLIQNVIC